MLMQGARTVNGRTSTSQTIRATVAVTATASGELLEPLIVFKGKLGGRIESREFATYPPGAVYACQDAAWMDERVMLKWVELVLKPYVKKGTRQYSAALVIGQLPVPHDGICRSGDCELGCRSQNHSRRLHWNVSAH